ncbi:MAG TPA: hypothetical protein PLH91_10890 [Tenuifilaceae bacterium]|nr:hypothetical protein [Tenuifilaceae bacterium]HPI45729.1 hypothetical protein [Tenuifilaceae bacterium]HPN22805.1 hypothetical protein [Tenuifilaceae bacterium]
MKKLFTLIAVFALASATFVSCEKDDEESITNSITIAGTVYVGAQQLTSPTFNLGNPENHEGFLATFYNKAEPNAIIIEPVDLISIGNNLYLYYEMQIYSASIGQTTMYCNVSIYEGQPGRKVSGFYVSADDITVNLTKVGAVGEYIEGTYNGTFYIPVKSVPDSYQINGKFKVKRIAEPVPQK